MKQQVEAKEIEVCDFCQREGFLQSCVICQAQYCVVHVGHVAGSWGFENICTRCSKRADVLAVCLTYAKKLTPIFRKRKDALIALRCNP